MKTKETKDLEERLVCLRWKGINRVIFEVDLGLARSYTYAKNCQRPLGDSLGGYCPPDDPGIADAISFENNGMICCYEIKVSVSDFHSNAKLSFIGDKNYFVLTEKVWNSVKDEIEEKFPNIGVYIPDGQYYLKCVKPAKRMEMNFNRESVLVCMLRSASNETTLGNVGNYKRGWHSQCKKLKYFTIDEIRKLCWKYEDCSKCPLKDVYGCFGISDLYDCDLEKTYLVE